MSALPLSFRHPMRLPLLSCLACALAACSPAPPDGDPAAAAPAPSSTAATTAPPPGPPGDCVANVVPNVVGELADDALIERAQRESGASGHRVVRPGTAMVGDHDGNRLNIHVDDADRVTELSCG